MGKPGQPVEHQPAREEVVFAYSDHGKVKRVFGDRGQTSLTDGLARMAAWANGVGIQKATPFEGVELARNLPPSWRKLLSPS
jgi:UDP-glucose 4-epimerase